MFKKNSQLSRTIALISAVLFSVSIQAKVQTADNVDLPDAQYYGYKVAHHMAVSTEHIQKFGLNTFDHPPISDHSSFVITPALDHFYSKAIGDLRFGPVVIDSPAKDQRYASIQIVDQEHYTIFDKDLADKGERIVLVREDYQGKIPKGTLIKTKSNFPFIFIRTQSYDFNNDKLADMIRRQIKISGVTEPVALPDVSSPNAVINWSKDNSIPYQKTEELMNAAAKTYNKELHIQAVSHLKNYARSGAVKSNVGMFEPLGHKAGGSHKTRAVGTLLGHLGFPVHHAYYQNIAIDRDGQRLNGNEGPLVLTLPHAPGVTKFWSLTRYNAQTLLPFDPKLIGGHNIQSYNNYNTKPDANGNVSFTFSIDDPKDASYWIPVTAGGYYNILRYYSPTSELNGNTAMDILYKGTALEATMSTPLF
jgi:hypothetical protein